jgi:hypothetical protein
MIWTFITDGNAANLMAGITATVNDGSRESWFIYSTADK